MDTKKLLTCCGLITCMFSSQPILASDECTIGDVSGWVHTTNLSNVLQSGVIKLVIEVDGEIYFKRKGVIIGQITYQGSNEDGLPTASLEHDIFFGFGNRMETFNDRAVLIPTKFENGIPCEFDVSEVISEAIGTKRLKHLSNDEHEIFADGSVSFCSDKNKNKFELSGTVCIK